MFTASSNLEINIRCRENISDYEPQYPLTTVSPPPMASITASLSTEKPNTTTVDNTGNTTEEEQEEENGINDERGTNIPIEIIIGNILSNPRVLLDFTAYFMLELVIINSLNCIRQAVAF